MARAPKQISQMSAEELALRKWSLNVASKMKTFSHHHFEAHLENSRHLMNEHACRKFLYLLDKFEILKATKHNTSITTSYSQRIPYHRALGSIDLFPLDVEDKIDLGYQENSNIWDVEVPVTITYTKGLNKKTYRFISAFQVLETDLDASKYTIINWRIRVTKYTMSVKNRNLGYNKSRYDSCESINFVNTDDIKDKISK